MKLLNEWFEDKEFEELKATKLKTGLTWRKFILSRCLIKEEIKYPLSIVKKENQK